MKKGSKPEIADVFISVNKIIKITKSGTGTTPAKKIIAATVKFLIPALIDSHCLITQMRMMSAPVMDPPYMVSGVTTVRDMATGDAEWDNKDLGGRFDDTGFQGPRVLRAAGFSDGPPGVFSWAIIPENKKEGEKYIDEVVENKINIIKIYSYLQPDIMKYLADSASKRGLS
ncbi:MAG: hypothetical protein MUC95_09555 [Spirochaetes bacterium]|jgi:hypothetical protein|nr:hypothetical protein [Spirochaetota bacterium]